MLVFSSTHVTINALLSTSFLFLAHCEWSPRLEILRDDVELFDDFLTQSDFDHAQRLSRFDLKSLFGSRASLLSMDPTLLGGKYEGDIAGFIRPLPWLLSYKAETWPTGIVPYIISSVYSSTARAMIAKVFADIQEVTCIKFVPKTSSYTNYIYILPDNNECYSSAGMVGGGMQKLSLGEDCFQYGTIVHELSHALGRWHEQSRPDRDAYIQILWNNIIPSTKNQFMKHSKEVGDENEMTLPYDYSSIMHYSPYAFSRNGFPTIKPLRSGGDKMGQRDALSPLDVQKLNLMYKCDVEIKKTSNFSSTEGQLTTKGLSTFRNRKCVDKSNLCSLWRVLGSCKETFLATYCPQSCGLCRDNKKRPSTARPITTTTHGAAHEDTISPSELAPDSSEHNCKDQFEFSCGLWEKLGHCEKRSDVMAKYCRKTCKICTDVMESSTIIASSSFSTPAIEKPLRIGANCSDSIPKSCQFLAKRGYCEKLDFVRESCQLSCNTCDKEKSIKKTYATPCKNQHESCTRWAKLGYCNRPGYSEYVKSKCPVSCIACGGNGIISLTV